MLLAPSVNLVLIRPKSVRFLTRQTGSVNWCYRVVRGGQFLSSVRGGQLCNRGRLGQTSYRGNRPICFGFFNRVQNTCGPDRCLVLDSWCTKILEFLLFHINHMTNSVRARMALPETNILVMQKKHKKLIMRLSLYFFGPFFRQGTMILLIGTLSQRQK